MNFISHSLFSKLGSFSLITAISFLFGLTGDDNVFLSLTVEKY